MRHQELDNVDAWQPSSTQQNIKKCAFLVTNNLVSDQKQPKWCYCSLCVLSGAKTVARVHDFRIRKTFKNVHFSYNPNEPILRDVSFQVAQGETVAIVGATGAGKSTIISALMGFYPYSDGSITIDGIELKKINVHALREQLALVLQDVFLFSDTVRANIVLGDERISDEVLLKAAEAIGISEFIEELPEGLDYNVQERGGVLSAGQRQLLAFLRAYVTNPKVLILDEATSSIDSHTEELIQRALIALTKDRTSVIIAHRLSTIQHADRIIVLDKGQVVEMGNHSELLAKEGAYFNLYEKQFASEV